MTISRSWRSALDPQRVMQVTAQHWQDIQPQQRDEQLTVEEPLEIRLGGQSLAVIMRTPGNDAELALGFLLTEGIIQHFDDVLELTNALDDDAIPLPNVVDVTLRSAVQQASLQAKPTTFERHFAVSASCGLCGKNSIADLLVSVPPIEPDKLRVSASTLYTLANQLRSQQAVFSHTGGLHAAGLFDHAGTLQLLREDVGRHNAVDKLIGYSLQQGLYPCRERILLVSGRTSFEIIQKALVARISCLAAISAPSSLAVELAASSGITLIGFLRDHSMNVYTHPERVIQ